MKKERKPTSDKAKLRAARKEIRALLHKMAHQEKSLEDAYGRDRRHDEARAGLRRELDCTRTNLTEAERGVARLRRANRVAANILEEEMIRVKAALDVLHQDTYLLPGADEIADANHRALRRAAHGMQQAHGSLHEARCSGNTTEDMCYEVSA